MEEVLKFFTCIAKNYHTLDHERFREVVEAYITENEPRMEFL